MGKPRTHRIHVSLTQEEAEALLAFMPGEDGKGHRLYDVHPNVMLHARAKLIDKLLARPGYVPPVQREREANARV